MNKIIFSSLSLALLTFTANFSLAADPATETAISLEQYTNAEKNYSISYPSTWKKADAPKLDIVLFAPPKNADENSHASMNIVSEKVEAGVTLDQFYKESASNLKTALENVVIEKTGEANLNGTQAKWLLYTHIMQNVKFRVLQYFIVAQGNLYLVTFSSVVDSFDSYRHDFDAIAKSFKLLKSPSEPSVKAQERPATYVTPVTPTSQAAPATPGTPASPAPRTN